MIRKIFPLMLVALMALVACEQEKPTPNPAQPTQLGTPALTVQSSDYTSFTVAWTAVENATGYTYQVDNNDSVNTTKTEITVNDLTAGTYTFKVQATSTSEEFSASEWASVEITIEEEPAPDPEDFHIEITINEVNETDATITVTPNNDETIYFARVITVQELITFDIYQYDDEIIMYLMENPDREDYIYTGETVLEPTRLSPDYTYMVVALDYINAISGAKLFKKEFTTQSAEVERTIEVSEIEVGYTDVSFHVTPSDNSEYWYFEWMSTESYEEYGQHVIIHAYYGLQNLALSYGFNNLGEFLQQVAYSGEDDAYITGLKNETDYTVMVFYVDPQSTDPTQIYDWNYTPFAITTLSPTGNEEPEITVSNATVTDLGSGLYELSVTVNANDCVISLQGAAAMYESCANYFDQGWEAIKAFFWLRDLGADALAAAKTENGYVYTKSGLEAGDYVFLFEGANAEGVMVYNGYRFDESHF